MREIKFRAWHKLNKKFISFYQSGIYMWENGQIYADGMNVTDRIVLLQYTGLKDKNGKEIYDGSFFRNKWKVGHETLHQVYYCDEELAFMSLTKLDGEFIKESLAGYAIDHDIEVIGNIFDNPELLEESS